MKKALTILALAAATASAALAASCRPPDLQPSDVADAGNAFACDLYARLRDRPGNIFFSPSSLTTALAMTYAGARGATADAMAATLHLPGDRERVHAAYAALLADLEPDAGASHALNIANRLWSQRGFALLPDYLATVDKYYDGGCVPLDFAGDTEGARRTINAWVADRTENRIKDLLQPGTLDGDTRLVLTNAIYFLGQWRTAFDPRLTRDGPFHLSTGERIETPIMRRVGRLRHAAADGVGVLELPYDGGELSCLILLPDARDGLADLERRLTPEQLAAWTSGLTLERVRCLLPRFEMTSSFELGPVLSDMGMGAAFGPAADFSGMTGHRDLVISQVVHKAFVKVDEVGTEAAAATAVVAKMTAVVEEDPPVPFVVDHPFLFLIRHDPTGSILFLGRVADPR